MSTKTRFEKEAKGNSEMAYLGQVKAVYYSLDDLYNVTAQLLTLLKNVPRSC